MAEGGWRVHTIERAGSSLAWTGWKEPTVYENGTVTVFLDGFVFNARELGHGNDGAAVIAELYRRHGLSETLTKINGDFSFVLVDGAAGTSWLVRDRFGVKPLYYMKTPDALIFASRPAALGGVKGVPIRPNPRFVARFAGSHYRTFDNEIAESPYLDIEQLPAAHLLEFRDGSVNVRRWWDIPAGEDLPASSSQLAEQYRDLLLDAVRLRVDAAHAPAFTLSGGLDSSSILSCAVKITGHRQEAYSSVYEDRTYDESDDIAPMVRDRVANWRRVLIGNSLDLYELVKKLVVTHDEPVATATWLSHYVLAAQAKREGFGSLFGGLGGDELNAGEYEYFVFHFADLLANHKDVELESEITAWARHHDHPIFRKSRDVALSAIRRLTVPSQPGRILPDRGRLNRYLAVLIPDLRTLADADPIMDHPFDSCLKNRTYQDIFRETAPCCLRAEDRNATAFNLDHFDPFFDHRLAEFMFRVPGDLKIRGGVTKQLLRQAMAGILPEETRLRIAKTGWNAPAHRWFSGSQLDSLRDIVASRSFRERGIYQIPEVERIISEHDSIVASGAAQENHMMFLWQLINLHFWLDSLPA